MIIIDCYHVGAVLLVVVDGAATVNCMHPGTPEVFAVVMVTAGAETKFGMVTITSGFNGIEKVWSIFSPSGLFPLIGFSACRCGEFAN